MTQTETPTTDSRRSIDRHRRNMLGVLTLGAVAAACSSSDTLALDGAATPNQTGASGAGTDAGAEGAASIDAGGPQFGVLEVRTKPDVVALPVPESNSSPLIDLSSSDGTPATTATTTASNPQATTSTTTGTQGNTKPTLVVTVPGTGSDGSTTSTTSATSTSTGSDSSTSSTSNPSAPSTTQAPTTTTPVAPPPPVNADAVLVANRITFGLSPALSAQLNANGVAAFVQDQLQRTTADPAVEARLGQFNLFGRSPKATYDAVRNGTNGRLNQELFYSNVLRATFSRSQLYEMMCHLWMDHFNVNILAMNRIRHLHVIYQEDVIRRHAMGSFRDLLKATAQAPAMLTYLDNDTSNARSEQGLNENYGRELLELHTLGIDENGGQIYTEADVVAAARAMSGWSMESSRRAGNYSEFLFRPGYQYQGEISLLNGAWTSRGTSGKQTGDSLLDFLATHPGTARYVAYKLCRRFVSDAPPSSLVASTARVFLDNDTNLVPTLRHILQSPEFAASAGQKFRRPFEHMVASLRAVNARLPDAPNSKGAGQLRTVLTTTDHVPWEWPSPDGYPDTAVEWLDGSGLSARWTYGARLARNGIADVAVDLRTITPSAANVGELIAKLANGFGLGTLNPTDVDAIAGAVDRRPSDAASSATDSLGDIVGLLLAHPLFQIR